MISPKRLVSVFEGHLFSRLFSSFNTLKPDPDSSNESLPSGILLIKSYRTSRCFTRSNPLQAKVCIKVKVRSHLCPVQLI